MNTKFQPETPKTEDFFEDLTKYQKLRSKVLPRLQATRLVETFHSFLLRSCK